MTEMDHNEAVRLLAAEKYLLGELPNLRREEYEEHYFDCADCAEDITDAVAFMESARQVFRD
jgi:anti-sigma factor RsiW